MTQYEDDAIRLGETDEYDCPNCHRREDDCTCCDQPDTTALLDTIERHDHEDSVEANAMDTDAVEAARTRLLGAVNAIDTAFIEVYPSRPLAQAVELMYSTITALREKCGRQTEIINTLNAAISEYDGTPDGIRAALATERKVSEWLAENADRVRFHFSGNMADYRPALRTARLQAAREAAEK